MRGRQKTKQALARLEEVRDTIREAEVELREATHYPPPETRHHLSEANSNLAAAEKALRTVLGFLETSGEDTTAEVALGCLGDPVTHRRVAQGAP